jgi:predicted DnaQ family exonuclease/DinG family helicase
LLGISFPDQHRALQDALATKDLFLALVGRLYDWDITLLEEITRASEGSDWLLKQLLRDILTERTQSTLTPLIVQPRSHTTAQGKKSIREQELPPLVPTRGITAVDSEALTRMLLPDGLLACTLPNYEHRQQQVDMLLAVCEAFNTPSHLLVEAGTGVGKSIAYLLPAVHFATQNGRRVVISSLTINLQDQLLHKDIPGMLQAVQPGCSVAVLKGQSNYLCMRQLRLFRRNRQLSSDEARVLSKVLYWMGTTTTGDRSELLLLNTEMDIWNQLQASPETCMRDLCPYKLAGDCFFYRARSRAERTNLIIVNHALLLSDLSLENRILPEYDYLIIDEAHHLEDVATDQFGFSVDSRDLYAFLAGLSHQEGAALGGLLGDIPGVLHLSNADADKQSSVYGLIEEMSGSIVTAQHHLQTLFLALEHFVDEHTERRGANQDGYDERISLTDGLRKQPSWSGVESAWENWSVPSKSLLQNIDKLGRIIESLEVSDLDQKQQIQLKLGAQTQHGVTLFGGLQRVLTDPTTEEIYWLTINRRDGRVILNSAPLSVADMLRERLFETKQCIVLTSATLRTSESFSYIKDRLGLDDPVELALGSPFDFKSKALLYVPNDLPEPNQPQYQNSVERALVDLGQATKGRMMVLFTSNNQLNTTYRAIQRPLEEEGIVVFAQGADGSRRQILDNFRNTDKAVLLGTRSFWEGVDVVGQALSCVVIVRLPFSVPTDPIFAARSSTFEDPFKQYSLPEAILRLRQGFGRLIRSKDDYGIVVVLDKRLLTKEYGKMMLRSLPPCTARQGPLAALPNAAQRWLDPHNRG